MAVLLLKLSQFYFIVLYFCIRDILSDVSRSLLYFF
jgi:hypothetical protein